MVRCHNCGTENLDGSEYCDECGMRLTEKRASTADLMRPPGAPSFTSSTSTPKPATPAAQHGDGTPVPSSTSAGQPAAVAHAASAPPARVSAEGAPARLVIERGGRVGKEFP